MNSKKDLEMRVMMAAQNNGIRSVLFRNAIGRKLGLNIADGECLSYLSLKGHATPTELARYTGLTTGSTTALLDRLENAGFIRRTPNPSDRRGILVEITGKWTETTGPLVSGIQKSQRELVARYSEQELATITDFLTRFADNVEKQTATIEKET